MHGASTWNERSCQYGERRSLISAGRSEADDSEDLYRYSNNPDMASGNFFILFDPKSKSDDSDSLLKVVNLGGIRYMQRITDHLKAAMQLVTGALYIDGKDFLYKLIERICMTGLEEEALADSVPGYVLQKKD
ncbi:hypothetical protein Ancab_017494 [Ancistrocladus abbreviatus]